MLQLGNLQEKKKKMQGRSLHNENLRKITKKKIIKPSFLYKLEKLLDCDAAHLHCFCTTHVICCFLSVYQLNIYSLQGVVLSLTLSLSLFSYLSAVIYYNFFNKGTVASYT